MEKDENTDRVLARLEELEKGLSHVKILLVAVIALLLFGFFHGSTTMAAAVKCVSLALFFVWVVYAVVWFIWELVMLKRRPRTDKD